MHKNRAVAAGRPKKRQKTKRITERLTLEEFHNLEPDKVYYSVMGVITGYVCGFSGKKFVQ